MLPPYNNNIVATFCRRLVAWRLIDWDGALLQVRFALTQPSRLSQLASHRIQATGRMGREDPGVFLILLYLTAASGLIYGVTFIAGDLKESPWLLFWGFIIWPLIVHGLICVCLTALLVFVLKKFMKINSRKSSLALSLGQSLEELVPVVPTTSAVLKMPTNTQVEWFYCFDLICNSSVPGLAILYISQFIFLPVTLAKPDSLSLQIFQCGLGNIILTGSASVAFVYNLAVGISVYSKPVANAASIIFVPLAIWIITLIGLTLAQVNLTASILHITFGWMFRDV